MERSTLNKTFNIDDEVVSATVDSTPTNIINTYKELDVDVTDLKDLCRNALIHWVSVPPTEEQAKDYATHSLDNKSMMIFLKNKRSKK